VAKWAKGTALRRALRERDSVQRLRARATAAIIPAGWSRTQNRTCDVMDSALLISGVKWWRLSAWLTKSGHCCWLRPHQDSQPKPSNLCRF